MTQRPGPRTVLVTGANGYLGSAVARAFSRAGWLTYGLVRRPASTATLLRNEILPVVGSAKNHVEWLSLISPPLPAFDVVVTTTEDMSDWEGHFNDNVAMLRNISEQRKSQGKSDKLLVLYTSGCKDYGMTSFHGDADLAPHTEQSPLNPPPLIAQRTENSLRILNYADDFDAVSLRPTTFFGNSMTYYGILFDIAAETAAREDRVLTLEAKETSILHGTHVDDAADAYVALAETERDVVKGHIYNIAAQKYDTLADVAGAMERSYGIKVTYKEPGSDFEVRNFMDVTVMFPQWVGSERIRKDTGWTEKRLGFIDGFELYRKTFEQLDKDGDEGVQRVRDLADVTF